MTLSFLLCLGAVLPAAVNAAVIAGSPTSFSFPPAGVTIAGNDPNFPPASVVGHAGPTPTGDEATALETAPAYAPVKAVFPLIEPQAYDAQKNTDFDITKHWGNLSPFQSVKSFGLDNASPKVPDNCDLQQVHLVHRHGARYPTPGTGPAAFAAKVYASAKNGTFKATGDVDFLNTWTYRLGGDILTPFGRSELYNLGVGFRVNYGDLLKGFKKLPVFRTTSQDRILDSSLNFAAGFFGVRSYEQSYHQYITIEAGGINNTLAPYTCPNAEKTDATALRYATQWQAIYLKDAQARLGASLPGFNLTLDDLYSMQQLCAYETVALGYSAFCELFTEDEWRGHEYYNDLWFWYGYGPGSPTNSALGIGWVQELVARLTQTPITVYNTSANGTLDSNPTLFPLDQPIYVDATHDVYVTAILSALNISSLAANGPLPADYIPQGQTYRVNELAPFATNLVGQVLSCSSSNKTTKSIRWILNDGVLPTTGIAGCQPNADGLCDLDTFVRAMKQRIAEVDWDYACNANYTIPPSPDNLVDGMARRK